MFGECVCICEYVCEHTCLCVIACGGLCVNVCVDTFGLCEYITGHDVNFCSDLPCRASEIQFSLALLQLSLALEKL